MKVARRVILTLACSLALALPVLADQTNVEAPVDEYFGQQKISPLGIDNMIHDTEQRLSSGSSDAGRLYGWLMSAEDALEDWAGKYPHDNWIPKRAYEMSHLFSRMHSAEATAAADRCRNLLLKKFSTSPYAELTRGETPSLTASDPALQAQGSQPSVVSDPWLRFGSRAPGSRR